MGNISLNFHPLIVLKIVKLLSASMLGCAALRLYCRLKNTSKNVQLLILFLEELYLFVIILFFADGYFRESKNN